MIGQRLESPAKPPRFAWLMLAAGMALSSYGWLDGREPLVMLGLLPITISLARLILARSRRFAAELTEGGIVVESPSASIPYESFRHVRAGGKVLHPSKFRKASSTLHVVHDRGVLEIPGKLDVPSSDLFQFLHDRVPLSGGRQVNPTLGEYLERQESYFGPENVWTYRAETSKIPLSGSRDVRAFGIGLFLTGVLWITFAATRGPNLQAPNEGPTWVLLGILAIVLGILITLGSFTTGFSAGQAIKGWKLSSLVISPQGMAMVQGAIEGEVRWAEVLDIIYKGKKGAVRLSNADGLDGIRLKVKGAEIVIVDLYDRPLHVIHERILVASGRVQPLEEI